jgi:hypothetical protein
MEYQMDKHMPSENIFLKAEKKNIIIGAIVLLLIGLALFFLTFTIFSGEELFLTLILPIFCMITGISGLYSVVFDSNRSGLVYYILLIILIIKITIIALLSVGILVYYIIDGSTCNSYGSSSCTVMSFYLILLFVLVCIYYTAFAIMLFVFLKNIKNYREDMKQYTVKLVS